MKIASLYFLVLGLVVLLSNCTQIPDYPNEPQITYMGANKRTILQGSSTVATDTLRFSFSFTDGDGDLKDGKIVIYESRDTGATVPGNLTLIPQETYEGGISGEVIVTLPNRTPEGQICCSIKYGEFERLCFVDPQFPQDTFSYIIQVQDRAGNLSNVIRTETFTILCQ